MIRSQAPRQRRRHCRQQSHSPQTRVARHHDTKLVQEAAPLHILAQRSVLMPQQPVRKTSPIHENNAETSHQSKEPAQIIPRDAVINPDAVVVHAGDAGAADAAVFRAGGLGEVTSPAEAGGVVEGVVVGVVREVRGVVEGRNEAGGGGGGHVGEEVGERDQEGDGDVVGGGETGPGGEEEEGDA